MKITKEQCKAARAMLNLSRSELAEISSVSERTLVDFERGARNPYQRTLRDVRAALENGGVTFIDENGGGPGVRLKVTPD